MSRMRNRNTAGYSLIEGAQLKERIIQRKGQYVEYILLFSMRSKGKAERKWRVLDFLLKQ